MSSLVLELQRDATEKSVSESDLLRKALVVARKLRVTEIQQWLTNELNGYPVGATVPAYRTLRGELRAHNPYRGWVPLHMSNSEQAEALSKSSTSQPISELEDPVRGESGTIYVKFPKKTERNIMRRMDLPMEPAVLLAGSQIRGLLDTVRNIVLDWALDLEEKGISGEGMSFTVEEKQQASTTTVNINNPVNFNNQGTIVGSMDESQIQNNSSGSTQTYTKTLDLDAVRQLIEEMKLRIPGAAPFR
jgi:hypothetical protein